MKNNFVAKNAHKYNKSVVHKNRKASFKKGYRKHKAQMEKRYVSDSSICTINTKCCTCSD